MAFNREEELPFFKGNYVAVPGRIVSFNGSARPQPELDADPLNHEGVGKPGTVSDVVNDYISQPGLHLKNVTYSVAVPSRDFILRVKTDNTGPSGDSQFELRLPGSGTYDYLVDWGDGSAEERFTVNTSQTHTFPSAGEYDVSIKGLFPRIYYNNAGDSDKITELKQWGTIEWQSMNGAFFGCSNMDITATDQPDLSNVLDYTFSFTGCTSIAVFPTIDVSAGQDFSWAWAGCSFTSFPALTYTSATTLFRAWFFCTSLTTWNGTTTSNLVSLRETWEFAPLTAFPYIETVNVTDMAAAWVNADFTTFPLLNTSKVLDFEGSFFGVKNLTLSALDTSAAKNMFDCFRNGNGLVLTAPLDLRSLVAGTSTGGNRMYENTDIGKTFWDATLIATETNNPNNGVYLHGGSAQYSAGPSAAATARAALVVRTWVINDGGPI